MTTPAPFIMIQARVGSTRLPGKVLLDLCGEPVLGWVVRRCLQSRLASGVAVLTTDLDRDDPVAESAQRLGAQVYRGSEADVLLRYVSAARLFRTPALVRVTADCPFIDPDVVDQVIDAYRRRPADYVCVRGYPEGVGSAELMRLSALETALARTTPSDGGYREHVMTYLTDHPDEFDLHVVAAEESLRRYDARFSIDTIDDLARARRVAGFFHPSRDFRTAEILAWANRNPAGPDRGGAP